MSDEATKQYFHGLTPHVLNDRAVYEVPDGSKTRIVDLRIAYVDEQGRALVFHGGRLWPLEDLDRELGLEHAILDDGEEYGDDGKRKARLRLRRLIGLALEARKLAR